jgi:putative phage-type endonuclease
MRQRALHLGTVGTTLTHDEWLRLRRQGIGGSDAAAIAGASDWSSPMSVYLDKVGASPPIETNEAMHWGNKLEAAVAAEFERQRSARITGRQFFYRSRLNPFMTATIDGRYRGTDNRWELYEGKTTSAYNRDAWSEEEVPLAVYVQVQHNLAVMGYYQCGVACLIGGQHFVSHIVRRDNDFIEKLIEREREFYETHMVPQVPPPVDGSSASTDALAALYPQSTGEVIDPLPEAEKALELVEAYAYWKGEVAAAEEELANASNSLKLMLGESEAGMAGQWRVAWSNRVRRSIDAKALAATHPEIASQFMKEAQYRVFSIKEMKDRD